MENMKFDTSLPTQLAFMDFMIETNNHEILKAIKNSLLELKKIKDEAESADKGNK